MGQSGIQTVPITYNVATNRSKSIGVIQGNALLVPSEMMTCGITVEHVEKTPAVVRCRQPSLDTHASMVRHLDSMPPLRRVLVFRILGFSKSNVITVIEQAHLVTCTPASGEICR
jgi:hypothetical protein